MDMKVCTRCKEEKPKTNEFWHERKAGTNIFKSICKECRKKEYKDTYKPRSTKPIAKEGCKICTVCKLELPSTLEFFNKAKSKDGISSRCRACRLKEQQEYRDNNKYNPIYKKKNIEHSKKYRKENKEKVKENVKRYYEINYKGQKHMKEYKHNHYEKNYANNEEFKEHKKKYQEENVMQLLIYIEQLKNNYLIH